MTTMKPHFVACLLLLTIALLVHLLLCYSFSLPSDPHTFALSCAHEFKIPLDCLKIADRLAVLCSIATLAPFEFTCHRPLHSRSDLGALVALIAHLPLFPLIVNRKEVEIDTNHDV
ncbi:MAG: hypothetical protein J3R72DRAFT_449765 [Linnemannia gamsii]|nr:MAG: hypothetical protein J3R72DRAFT_449765 [Linnemannia gamsii]